MGASGQVRNLRRTERRSPEPAIAFGSMDDYLCWEERASVPRGKVRADMTVAYADLLVVHVVPVSDGEPDVYTACHRLVPGDATLGSRADSGVLCRVCRRKLREVSWR